jgi:RNA polymerase sigma-70 factor (ECF subfamily)
MAGARTIRVPVGSQTGGLSSMMPAVKDDARSLDATDPSSAWSVAGDEISRLEARHGQALFGFVRRLGLSDDHAQDCVQEVFLRLWTEMQRGTSIQDPKAWAYRAVYRVAMDEHRLRRRISGLVDMIGGRMARASATVDQSDRIAVWAEVDRLPNRQRQVIYLRYRADLPFEDIGVVLGMTASAARSHATQATQTLRARLRLEPTSGDR